MGLPQSLRRPQLNKYDVLDELGHGGMATVYRARDRRLDRDVAVKVLHPHLRESTEIGHRFSAEARAVAKLRHPNIVEVYDVSDEAENERYLVVELVSGCTLRTLLAEQGRLPPEVAAAIAIELLHALEHAHEQGVVHRDVKPENVMVERRPKRDAEAEAKAEGEASEPSAQARTGRGQPWAVKLTDFGIAKLLDAKGVTSTGQVLGSPAHMAPEQIEGADVDARADVFGIGVLLYECMVGHLPFQGSNPAQVLRRVLEGHYAPAELEEPQVGKRWSQILDRALALRVEDRLPSAMAFTELLLQELALLGHGTPHELIERYLEDPSAFEAAHASEIKARLVSLGREAREQGRALDAAAHYNRALAYAPADPELLRLVTRLQRTSAARARMFDIAPKLLGVVLVGVGSFAMVRTVRARVQSGVDSVQPAPTSLGAVATTTTPTLTGAPSARATNGGTQGAAPNGTGRTFIVATAAVATPAASAARSKPRNLSFTSLRPSEGVLLSVDGEGARPLSAGQSIQLDGRPHELTFSCKGELCLRQTRALPAGETDAEMAVLLELKPAVVTVDGDLNRSYQINEYSHLGPLRAGVPVRVPLRRNDDAVTIIELETSLRRTLVLRAGGDQRVTFEKTP
jgi:serine/threonine-protein kinase